LERIKTIYRERGIISGTSAGAAVMSKIMITGDEIIQPDSNDSFTTIMKGNIATTQGFGFVTSAIIDQHFIYRKRHNRLLSLVLENPEILGIGIDESTAILVSPDLTFTVIGEYQVIVYDASESNDISTSDKGFFSSSNIKMHILKHGDKFNLITKEKIK
jgi:cyanophycinase